MSERNVLATLGARLRSARTAAKLDQAAVAEAVGVHPKTVSRWENDRQLPETAQLHALAALLKVSEPWLRYGDEIPELAASREGDRLPRAGAFGGFVERRRQELSIPGPTLLQRVGMSQDDYVLAVSGARLPLPTSGEIAALAHELQIDRSVLLELLEEDRHRAMSEFQQGLFWDPHGLRPPGQRLRDMRLRAGVTVEDAAEAVGVDPSDVADWERDLSAPSDTQREVLVRLYSLYSSDRSRPPRVSAGLPFRIRVWLQQELLDYAKAGVSDEELVKARQLLEAPELFSFYSGGAPRARTEDEVLKGMRGVAAAVRATLRERGYKLEPEPADVA